MLHIPVIFEDENILVLNKPSGIVVHPFDFSTEETLLDFLKEYSPSIFSIPNEITLQDTRVIKLGGIVHKLDRDTSGILVIAKNQETFNDLKKQFREHTLKKQYIALVEGTLEENSFIIDAPLGRNKKDYKQVANPTNPRGELRDATTAVEVHNRLSATTLVQLSPLTGRTHQLRAHMTFIGHPIVGDKAYGSTIDSNRIMLHAQSLTFTLDAKEYSFKAEIPQEFLEYN